MIAGLLIGGPDCDDDFVPIDLRYSVFVVLKPPTDAEQERALQATDSFSP